MELKSHYFSQDPVPPEPWTGIREATKYGDSCAQYDEIIKKYVGSEDCLYLNVYTPLVEKKSPRKFPVMVSIHGGAFIMGSGDDFMFGPDYLLRKDIIVVTLNYRLGVLGKSESYMFPDHLKRRKIKKP